MRHSSKLRFSTTAIITGCLAALLAAGGGVAWWAVHNLSTTSSRPTESPTQPRPIPVQEPTPPLATVRKSPATPRFTPKIYWLDAKSSTLVLKAESLKSTQSTDKQTVVTQGLRQLLARSTKHPSQTTIPANTKLLALTIKNDGIHLDLSADFSEGGGSDAMMGRLGQILYTATSLDPDENVWINVNGVPLELLGGEGIEVPQPITRRYFQENFQG